MTTSRDDEDLDRSRWSALQLAARRAMDDAPRSGRTLIEVASQHPLMPGGLPGEEFRARLDRALERGDRLREAGQEVEFYVPGSRHRHEGIEDEVSLSVAGSAYLARQGVATATIHGEDLNDRYLPDAGVYGSADECFVTAQFFRDGSFEGLEVVLSPFQLPRKMLHYIAFGVYPLAHTAPTHESYHDLVHELFVSVPHVLHDDATFQSDSSVGGRALRESRRP